jgi:GNAT superfamily N-acetyltransferase
MSEITLRPVQTGDPGWILERHGVAYAAAYGFNHEFEGLAAKLLGEYLLNRDPIRECGWVAVDDDGAQQGCIFCIKHDDTTARLRMFYLNPAYRGQGVGAKMMNHALDFARSQDFSMAILQTYDVHRAACALYMKTGFIKISAKPVHAYGQNIEEQFWKITL